MTFICLCLIGFGVWTLHAKLNRISEQCFAVTVPSPVLGNPEPRAIEQQNRIQAQHQLGRLGWLGWIAWKVIQAWL